jgi:polysaccharide pyruvyl transferase WcaK-like protein
VKVLHLASFHGNIGDNANHSGFRPWLERLAGRPVRWTDHEIREYYWKERVFDESFLSYVNEFDLFVIGGGNYFELWVERSSTGTSIDIAPELFSRIRPPVFFNALGCDAGQGVTENTVRRFNTFLELVLESRKCLVTVRNDGAHPTLRQHVPAALADRVTTIPDGGFFLETADPGPKPTKRRIGINLACDMPEVRFANFPGGFDTFCDEFAALLGAVAAADPEVDFVFFPHIYSDMKIISAVLGKMGDRLRRTRTSCAPYLTGATGARAIFAQYRHCDLMLGMRFHANVCALALGIPTIGLVNYPQVQFLYEELGYLERAFSVRDPGFSTALRELISSTPGAAPASVMRAVAEQRAAYEPVLSEWLRSVA